jgi:hypothetical protein
MCVRALPPAVRLDDRAAPPDIFASLTRPNRIGWQRVDIHIEMPDQRNSRLDRLGPDESVALGEAVLIGGNGVGKDGHRLRMGERWNGHLTAVMALSGAITRLLHHQRLGHRCQLPKRPGGQRRIVERFGEIAGDIAGPIVGEQPRFVVLCSALSSLSLSVPDNSAASPSITLPIPKSPKNPSTCAPLVSRRCR